MSLTDGRSPDILIPNPDESEMDLTADRQVADNETEPEFTKERFLGHMQSLNYIDFMGFLLDFDKDRYQSQISQDTADQFLDIYFGKIEEFARQQVFENNHYQMADESQKERIYQQLFRETVDRQISLTRSFIFTRKALIPEDGLNNKLLTSLVMRFQEDKNLENLREIINYIEQNAQIFDQTLLFEKLTEFLISPELTGDGGTIAIKQDYKDRLLHGLAYAGNYQDLALKEYLDEKLQQNWSDPVSLLKAIYLIEKVGLGARMSGYARRARQLVNHFLEYTIGNSTNYTVTHFAEHVNHGLEDRRLLSYHQSPFEITDALNATIGLDKNGLEAIRDIIREINQLGFLAIPLAIGYLGIYNKEGFLERFIRVDEANNGRILLRPPEDLPLHLVDNYNGHKADNQSDTIFLLSIPIRNQISQDFDVDLGSLDIRVQHYLLNFIKNQPLEKINKLGDYVAKTRDINPNFLTTFLSLEQDNSMGDVLFQLIDKFPEDDLKVICDQYTDLFYGATRVGAYLKSNFGDQFRGKPELEEKIVQNLLKKGKDLLEKVVKNEAEIDIPLSLAEYKAETQLIISTFKELRNAEEEEEEVGGDVDLPARRIDLEMFSSFHLEEIKGDQLTPELKDKLIGVVRVGWQKLGAIGAKIIELFPQILSNPEKMSINTFYLAQAGEEILGFFRLEDRGEELYLTTFTALPETNGLKVGRRLLENQFMQAARGKKVSLDADLTSTVCHIYSGKLKGVITDFRGYINPDDMVHFELDYTQEGLRRTEDYRFKGKSASEMLDLLSEYQDHREATIRVYDFPREKDVFIQEAKNSFNHQPPMVITNYIVNRESGEEGQYQVVVGYELREPANFTESERSQAREVVEQSPR